MNNINNLTNQNTTHVDTVHSFHMVTPSPWPLFTSISLFALTVGNVLCFHGFEHFEGLVFTSFLSLFYNMKGWWNDVITEATYEGMHPTAVQRGLRIGVLLFILSEVMFFFAFFWAFFHSSLAPTIDIGNIWPPRGIIPFKYQEIPLLNTLILLGSGATVTWAHSGFLVSDPYKSYEDVVTGLWCTISLGVLFTMLQVYEYIECPYDISDSIFGTTFFLATGFHGLHVLIGTIFLSVALYRQMFNEFTAVHHINFEAAAWYWHFVDVVWLFLYISIYFWGC